MDVLRQYVRSLLREDAGDMATTSGLALYVDSARHDTTFILYNPRYYATQMKEAIADARQHYEKISFKEDMEKFKNYYSFSNIQRIFTDPTGVYGYLEVNEGRMIGMDSSCNRANEVKLVAAREGYGTLMYLIGMNNEPPIMPSRGNVSGNAKEYWSYFDGERGKIDIEKFKDEMALRKKDIEDCEMVGDPVLDQSYKTKKKYDIGGLRSKHEMFLGQMQKYLKDHEVDFIMSRVKDYISEAGRSFYESTMGKDWGEGQ